jgi:MoaD family protein
MPVVKLFANLRKLAGTKETSITGSTIRAILNDLVKRNPSLDGVILENGRLCQHVVIMLNGYNISDMSVQVTEQDVLAIFPPIAGG